MMRDRDGSDSEDCARRRAAGTAAGEEFPPIYVAGYLALYDMGDGGALALTREVVRAALPPAAPLPINIDHRANCRVGTVLAVIDDDRGPFFLGRVNCPQLGAVLSSAASAEIFGDAGDALSVGERLLYLVTNYLPSASLSSRKLSPGDEPDDTLLAHVALCVIGRRVGTIVTYDLTPAGAVKPFGLLSAASRNAALEHAALAESASPVTDDAWAPGEEVLARTLLSTAVNNMLLRDRWKLVSRRRKQAGIEGHMYLQASSRFAFPDGCRESGAARDAETRGSDSAAGVREDENEDGEEPNGTADAVAAKNSNAALAGRTDSSPKLGVALLQTSESGDVSSSEDSERRERSVSAQPSDPIQTSMSTPPTTISNRAPPGDGDYVWVPMAHLSQLVAGRASGGPQYPQYQGAYQSGAYTAQQPPPVAAPPPFAAQHQPHQHTSPAQWYGVQPHQNTPLETHLAALLAAMAADRQAQATSRHQAGGESYTPQSPDQERRYCRKRHADWDDHSPSADVYFPGEQSDRQPCSRGGNLRSRERQGQFAGGEQNYGPQDRTTETLTGLIGAVTSLQREVNQLRAIQQYPTYSPFQPTGQTWPVQTAQGYACTNGHPPAQPPQPQSNQTTSAAHPVQSEDAQEPSPPQVPQKHQPQVTEPRTAATVDASAVAAMKDRTVEEFDGADIFISQMMSQR